jgi:hypothetical protein
MQTCSKPWSSSSPSAARGKERKEDLSENDEFFKERRKEERIIDVKSKIQQFS